MVLSPLAEEDQVLGPPTAAFHHTFWEEAPEPEYASQTGGGEARCQLVKVSAVLDGDLFMQLDGV
jgi:hypothetical protein